MAVMEKLKTFKSQRSLLPFSSLALVQWTGRSPEECTWEREVELLRQYPDFRDRYVSDIGYVLQKVQSERKKIEKLTATLHSIDDQRSNKHIFFAEDREEAKELQSQYPRSQIPLTSDDIPANIKRKIDRSYRELEARKNRLSQLEKIYMDMAMHKELQKKGKKRKLREDEIVCPTTKPVYKWRAERKR